MTENYRNILDNIKKEMGKASKEMWDGLDDLKQLCDSLDCFLTAEDIKKSFHILTGKQINQTELFDVLDSLTIKR